MLRPRWPRCCRAAAIRPGRRRSRSSRRRRPRPRPRAAARSAGKSRGRRAAAGERAPPLAARTPRPASARSRPRACSRSWSRRWRASSAGSRSSLERRVVERGEPPLELQQARDSCGVAALRQRRAARGRAPRRRRAAGAQCGDGSRRAARAHSVPVTNASGAGGSPRRMRTSARWRPWATAISVSGRAQLGVGQPRQRLEELAYRALARRRRRSVSTSRCVAQRGNERRYSRERARQGRLAAVARTSARQPVGEVALLRGDRRAARRARAPRVSGAPVR